MAEKRLQEELALEAADGLTVQASDSGTSAAAGDAIQGTRTFEHVFETAEGTDADHSADAAEAAQRAQEAKQSAETAAADELNTTPGGWVLGG